MTHQQPQVLLPSSPRSCLPLAGYSDVMWLTLTTPTRPGFNSFRPPSPPRRPEPLFYPPHLAKEKLRLREEDALPNVTLSKGAEKEINLKPIRNQFPVNLKPTLPSTMPISGAAIGTHIVTGSLSWPTPTPEILKHEYASKSPEGIISGKKKKNPQKSQGICFYTRPRNLSV